MSTQAEGGIVPRFTGNIGDGGTPETVIAIPPKDHLHVERHTVSADSCPRCFGPITYISTATPVVVFVCDACHLKFTRLTPPTKARQKGTPD